MCAGALSVDERNQLLDWHPSQELQSLLNVRSVIADDVAPAPPGNRVKTYADEPYYAFASYKRQDLARIAPIMQLVRDLGVPVWYDIEIPGGSEWDEVIEDRIAKSSFVIAFTSNAAIESKYVRREIKFADAIGLPVLGVLIENVELKHGLKMMMTQYQMLDAHARDFNTRLKQAVQRLFRNDKNGTSGGTWPR